MRRLGIDVKLAFCPKRFRLLPFERILRFDMSRDDAGKDDVTAIKYRCFHFRDDGLNVSGLS